jgi:hypothetical protein
LHHIANEKRNAEILDILSAAKRGRGWRGRGSDRRDRRRVSVKSTGSSALGVKVFTTENKLKGDGVINPKAVSAGVGLG